MELKSFQSEASGKLSNNIRVYLEDPLWIGKDKILPFYQTLKSITGSGKTLILADTLEELRSFLSTEPIVLWVSKGKVVVGQTLENLSNGKYSENIPNYVVKPLLDCKEIDIINSQALLLMATVGKFNQKDKADGDRRIFQTNLDSADISLWEMLKHRKNAKGEKRDLIIVYDEGHNLSDQQTKLLQELDPLVLISASATIKVPKELEWNIKRLQKEKNLSEEDLIVNVSNKEVVKSGLIKKHLSIGGYLTPMEEAIDSLLMDMKEVDKIATRLNAGFSPKAIYVSDTNMISSRSQYDEVKVPFKERQARPIQIWNYLVKSGVDPSEIAVYCNLKFDRNFPKPKEFNLFSGGDNDYQDFVKGDFKHIIFNQTLQEGWDDPNCCFAYIDKDMGSITQVTQIIGRVLRQPNVKHYSDERLNMANFYIKTDEKDVFRSIVEEIRNTLLADIPEVSITYHISNSRTKNLPTIEPKCKKTVPSVAIISDRAKTEIDLEIDKMIDYREDKVNTIGSGQRIRYVSTIGEDEDLKEVVTTTNHSNKVTARWVFKRELDKLAKKAITLCDISNVKFDALVEYNSNAADYIRELAVKISKIYRDKSRIVQNPLDTIEVGSVIVDSNSKSFKNSIHERYSDLNGFEEKFAVELDRLGLEWMRNPQNGYLKIALLDGKGTNNFNPDFIVWGSDKVFAIDTKGSHIIDSEARRKLFYVEKIGEGPDLDIKLISEKKYNDEGQVIDENGYTVWLVKQGKICTETCTLLSDAVKLCVN